MSTSTTLPRRAAGDSGVELSHSPPPSNEGRLPSFGRSTEDVIIGFTGVLQSLVAATTGLASIAARNSRAGFMTSTAWASASPRGTRGRAPGQEDPGHGHHPHETDDGRDELRIGAVGRPEPTPRPRCAAEQD